MLGEIIQELTKIHENTEITSKMCCAGVKELRQKEPNLPP